jgi:hypothetical protein
VVSSPRTQRGRQGERTPVRDSQTADRGHRNAPCHVRPQRRWESAWAQRRGRGSRNCLFINAVEGIELALIGAVEGIDLATRGKG